MSARANAERDACLRKNSGLNEKFAIRFGPECRMLKPECCPERILVVGISQMPFGELEQVIVVQMTAGLGELKQFAVVLHGCE